MNPLRFMSALTPCTAISYEPQSKPRPPMNLVKLPPPTMMSSPLKPFMTSTPATPPIITSLPLYSGCPPVGAPESPNISWPCPPLLSSQLSPSPPIS